MIYSWKKYKCPPIDYNLFKFYNKTDKERELFLTSSLSYRLITKQINNVEDDVYKLDNKGMFNKSFKEFLGRDWLLVKDSTYDEFLQFCNKHKIFMVKAQDTCQGKGIEKINIDNVNNIRKLYLELIEKDAIIEEYITQHHKMNQLCELSVNTIRVETILYNNEIYIPGYVLRVGNGASVDNFAAGGIICKVDDETGIIKNNGLNKKMDEFKVHPLSNIEFNGFKIPLWEDVKKLAIEASEISKNIAPGVKLIGWDIAITEDRPILIEANCFPDITMLQTLESKGSKQNYQRLMDDIKLNYTSSKVI